MPSNSSNRVKLSRGRALWNALHAFFASPLNGFIALMTTVAVLGLSFVVAEEVNARTNSTEFCISCHSMKSYVYEEFKQSKHFNTVSGVRPECGSCHVSRRFWPAVWDHLMGTEDLISEFTHDWSKAETFEAKRTAMAEKVRLTMLANDSKNCRSCHVMEAIAPARKRGARAHNDAAETGRTNCIACHYNLVHKEVPLTQAFSQAIKELGSQGLVRQ